MPHISRYTSAKTVLLLIILFKIAGVLLTTVTGLNTFAQSDVTTFAANAEQFAGVLQSGSFPVGNLLSVTYSWSLTIAPFWMLPGPSWLYARVMVATLGALAIYNVYVFARYHSSPRGGLVAVLPMIFLPSFLLVQGTILRDTVVLFGLTSVVRLLFVGSTEDRGVWTFTGVIAILAVITVYRFPNLFIYIAILATSGVVTEGRRRVRQPGIIAVTVAGFSVFTAFLVVRFKGLQEIVSYVASLRAHRTHGSAVYLAETVPNSVPEMLAFSWIGATHFLLVPFPWMVSEFAYLIASVESIVNVIYLTSSVFGFRYLYHRSKSATLSLSAGFLLAIVMYGLIEGNIGPAMRHRQQFIWIPYAFGAIGIVESFEFVLKDENAL